VADLVLKHAVMKQTFQLAWCVHTQCNITNIYASLISIKTDIFIPYFLRLHHSVLTAMVLNLHIQLVPQESKHVQFPL
jgi:hypothetical protein